MKKIFAILSIVVMSMLVSVSANAEIINSGTCGENLIWELDTDGILTISGTGDMYDFDWDTASWYAYRSCIKEVVIKFGVTSIGECAFYDSNANYAITQISIPDSVIKIGNYAFTYCKELSEIVIPDSVTDLGWSVFEDCTELKNVTIGSGVMYIDGGMFLHTYKLENINISSDNQNYCDIDGNLYTKSMSAIVVYASGKKETSFSVPEGVLVIGDRAICSDNLINISIPESVIIIRLAAIQSHSLKSLTIGRGVEKIEGFAIATDEVMDVYFMGTAEQWSQIDIDEDNRALFNAKIHYTENTTPMIFLSLDNISVSGIRENYILLVACYKDSVMLDAKKLEISENITKTISEIGVNISGADRIKAFLWTDMQSVTPACGASSVLIE